MITFRSLKATLTALLKKTAPDMKVHFDNVEKSDVPYFYVEMNPLVNTVDGDGIYHDRSIEVDITYVPAEDKYGRISRITLFDMAEKLDRAIFDASELLRIDEDYYERK